MKTYKTIIFDLGAVLIQWDPRNLYRKIFTDEEEMEYFLATICTKDWNEQQDAGRPFQEAIEQLSAEYPKYSDQIKAFHSRWPEMLNGAIEGTVEILKEIHSLEKYQLLVLSNWSAETYPFAVERFDFLDLFDGKIISGKEFLKKPDPKIYQLLKERFDIDYHTSLFIDDSQVNVDAGNALGIDSILFVGAEALREELRARSVI